MRTVIEINTDNTQSEVYSICHDKIEINSLIQGWLPVCINIPCIHRCSFPLFPKQTFGNDPASEVSVCYLFLAVVLFSFTRVGNTCHSETCNICKCFSKHYNTDVDQDPVLCH